MLAMFDDFPNEEYVTHKSLWSSVPFPHRDVISNYLIRLLIDPYKFALVWGEAQLCMPYVCSAAFYKEREGSIPNIVKHRSHVCRWYRHCAAHHDDDDDDETVVLMTRIVTTSLWRHNVYTWTIITLAQAQALYSHALTSNRSLGLGSIQNKESFKCLI